MRVSFLAGIALAVVGLSLPIAIPPTPIHDRDVHVQSGDVTHASLGIGADLTSPTPDRAILDEAGSVFIEEDKDESSSWFSHLISPAFFTSDWPSRALLGPLPGNLPSRTVSVPLRC